MLIFQGLLFLCLLWICIYLLLGRIYYPPSLDSGVLLFQTSPTDLFVIPS